MAMMDDDGPRDDDREDEEVRQGALMDLGDDEGDDVRHGAVRRSHEWTPRLWPRWTPL